MNIRRRTPRHFGSFTPETRCGSRSSTPPKGSFCDTLARLFRRWYGPIPPIKEVRARPARGKHPARLVRSREELTSTDPPSSFTYRLTDITGALGPLVDHIDGAWTFTPVGTGAEVGWRWTMYPRSRRTRPGVVLLGKLWNGYARAALGELADQLAPNA